MSMPRICVTGMGPPSELRRDPSTRYGRCVRAKTRLRSPIMMTTCGGDRQQRHLDDRVEPPSRQTHTVDPVMLPGQTTEWTNNAVEPPTAAFDARRARPRLDRCR